MLATVTERLPKHTCRVCGSRKSKYNCVFVKSTAAGFSDKLKGFCPGEGNGDKFRVEAFPDLLHNIKDCCFQVQQKTKPGQ